MTPSEIEPVTFRFVAQHLNHCATAVPTELWYFNILLNAVNYFSMVQNPMNYH